MAVSSYAGETSFLVANRHVPIAAVITAGTPAVIWTPAAGRIIRVLGWQLSSSIGNLLNWEDSGDPGITIFTTPQIIGTDWTHSGNIGRGHLLGARDNTLNLAVNLGTDTIIGMVWGRED